MNRQLTAAFAAFEALLVLAIGVAIPLAPLTIIWAVHYGFALDWAVFWRASADIWLVGHGVDMTMTLDPTTAATLGLPGAEVPFAITIGMLGFSVLTVLLGVRAGRRVAETRFRTMGQLVSLGTFALLSFLVALSAQYPLARPDLVQGVILPTVVFAVGVVIGMRGARHAQDDSGSSIRDWIDDWPPRVRLGVATALRGGAAAAAGVMLLATVVTTLAIVTSYSTIITLYESLHTEVLGGIAVTLGELAFLPNLVIFTASWLIGPGFALGTGSTVSPLGTTLGPIPAIPVLGAVPQGDLAFGFVGLLAPIIAAFLVGAVLGPRLATTFRLVGRLLVGVGIGVVGGVILGLLAWASVGAAGPGRLATVGPDPLLVGAWAALELSVAAILGLLASLRRPREADRTIPPLSTES